MKPTPLLLSCLIGLAIPRVGLAQPKITVQSQSGTHVGGAAPSAVATLTVLAPPFITRQPTNFPTLSLGATVGNRVTASGTAPIYYQWSLNGTNLPGATNSSLVITNLQLPNAGAYTVVATNSAGSATSVGVTLRVDPTFTKITTGAIVTDRGNFDTSSWADYDNDGFLDLLVGNSGDGGILGNVLYRNNRDGTFSRINASPIATDPEHTMRCAWGDYDNDGFLDLIVVNGWAGPENNLLYHNNGNSNAWIRIKCVGTTSNRAGLGAKVRVKATIAGQSRRQLRQIDGGDGTSGGSLEADFGLGDATNIDTVRIEWPSGIVQELHDVAPKQFLTVTEPARLQASEAGVLRIQSWKGMAFDVQVSTDLVQWPPLTTVTNLSGTLDFTDPDAANHLQRFYRTVLR